MQVVRSLTPRLLFREGNSYSDWLHHLIYRMSINGLSYTASLNFTVMVFGLGERVAFKLVPEMVCNSWVIRHTVICTGARIII